MEFESLRRIEWAPSIDESVDYKPKLLGIFYLFKVIRFNLGEKSYFVPAKIYDIDKQYKSEKSHMELKLIIKFYLDNKPK